jgi:hypothetical protein
MLAAALPVVRPASGAMTTVSAPAPPRYHKIRAVDADNHWVQLNRPGVVTIVVGTSEDSQEAARQAGTTMYPFEGRPDFQLIVVVDLRDSIATWVPSIVLHKMQANMDQEALELKPHYLQNGNHSNPRASLHVIPDFSGTICPQIGWPGSSDSLRAIIFGADGREFRRFDQVDDMAVIFNGVRDAILANIEATRARSAAAAKASFGLRTSALNRPLPPLPPPMPLKAP